MFYIIEKQEQLTKLPNLGNCFIQFIPHSYKYHPALQTNKVSLIYVASIEKEDEYIFSIDHNESLSLSLSHVLYWLVNNTKIMFLYNKKTVLHLTNGAYDPTFISKLKDINFLVPQEETYANATFSPCFIYFYTKNYDRVNCIIPISKHYEYCNFLFRKYIDINPFIIYEDALFDFKNTKTTQAFYEIEKEGITLAKSDFINQYEYIKNPELNIRDGKIFTQYNLYTSTGRPSNSFNEINFGAISKVNKERLCYKPSNSQFIEMDFEAFHICICAEILKYRFEEYPYKALAKMYFDKENVTEDEIKQSKHITFQQIYGGIEERYIKYPFFRLLQAHIDTWWDVFSTSGYITTNDVYFSLKDFPDITKLKLFNYIIQSKETGQNVFRIRAIQELLKRRKYKTKLVLYTYDSFLFDYSLQDGEKCLVQISDILKSGILSYGMTHANNYKLNIKKGNTYGELEKTNIYV